MKNNLIILSLALIIAGCKDGEYRKVSEQVENESVEYWVNSNNMKNGPAFAYYANGSLHYLMNYDSGFANGTFISYYENGTIQAVAQTIKGKKEGYRYKFFPSYGIQEISYHTDNNLRYIKEYDEKGNIIKYEGHLPLDKMGKTVFKVLGMGFFKRNKEERIFIYKKGCSYEAMNISIDEGELRPTEISGIYSVITRTSKPFVSISINVNLYDREFNIGDSYSVLVK